MEGTHKYSKCLLCGLHKPLTISQHWVPSVAKVWVYKRTVVEGKKHTQKRQSWHKISKGTLLMSSQPLFQGQSSSSTAYRQPSVPVISKNLPRDISDHCDSVGTLSVSYSEGSLKRFERGCNVGTNYGVEHRPHGASHNSHISLGPILSKSVTNKIAEACTSASLYVHLLIEELSFGYLNTPNHWFFETYDVNFAPSKVTMLREHSNGLWCSKDTRTWINDCFYR